MPGEDLDRRTAFIEEFQRHENRTDGQQVVTSLDSGLLVLRDLLYGRLHYDVEQIVGMDSMLIPLSEAKAQRATKAQIEIYQVVESAWSVQERQYVSSNDWYVDWLTRFRLGEMAAKEKIQNEIAAYRGMKPDGRRLAFTDVLMRVLPESRKRRWSCSSWCPWQSKSPRRWPSETILRRRNCGSSRDRSCPPSPTAPRATAPCWTTADFCDTCSNPMWTYKWLTVAD